MPFSVLKEAFVPDCYLTIDEHQQFVIIEENGVDATLREIKITEAGDGVFGIKHDHSQINNPLFREDARNKINQAVDGIIWTKLDESKHTFVIELKSSLPSSRGKWINKFHNAEGVLAQLRALKAVQDAQVFTDNRTSYFLFFNEATRSLVTSIEDAARLNVKRKENFFDGVLFQIANPPRAIRANDLAVLVN